VSLEMHVSVRFTPLARAFVLGWARGDPRREQAVTLMLFSGQPEVSAARVAAVAGCSVRSVELWTAELLTVLTDACKAEGWTREDLVVVEEGGEDE